MMIPGHLCSFLNILMDLFLLIKLAKIAEKKDCYFEQETYERHSARNPGIWLFLPFILTFVLLFKNENCVNCNSFKKYETA